MGYSLLNTFPCNLKYNNCIEETSFYDKMYDVKLTFQQLF